MIKKLTKHEDGRALVIDESVLELLEIDSETPLDITTDGRMLIVSPVDDEERSKKFDAALEKTNSKYGRTLKKLAE